VVIFDVQYKLGASMYSLEQAIKLFQAVNNGWCCTDAQTPTRKSIAYINEKLGIKLPSSLVQFVKSADKASRAIAL